MDLLLELFSLLCCLSTFDRAIISIQEMRARVTVLRMVAMKATRFQEEDYKQEL